MRKLVALMIVMVLSSAAYAQGVVEPITTTCGEEFRVVVSENPTTGYVWSVEGVKPKGRVSLLSDEYVSGRSEPEMVGVGGSHTFTFRALRVGRCRITFVLKRPWEQSITERKVYNIEIKKTK